MTIRTQMWIGEEEPQRSKFEQVSNSDDLIHKPLGGLWTSTVRDDGTSDWLDWVNTEDFYHEDQEVWFLEPREELDIVRIDRQVELESIIERYDRRERPSEPPLVVAADSFAPIDFERMAEEHDGIHLTESGQWETRMSRPGLYGWDAETVCWFHWRFESVEYQGSINDYMETVYDD